MRTLRAGDTAISSADEWHWHGAAADTMMTMISVQGTDENGAVVHWGEPAADLRPAAPRPMIKFPRSLAVLLVRPRMVSRR